MNRKQLKYFAVKRPECPAPASELEQGLLASPAPLQDDGSRTQHTDRRLTKGSEDDGSEHREDPVPQTPPALCSERYTI
jgi:hypothetical protein